MSLFTGAVKAATFGLIDLDGGPNLQGIETEAERKERLELEQLEKETRAEARFLSAEGKGLRRQAELSFGSQRRDKERGTEAASVRATGRFGSNRLVL